MSLHVLVAGREFPVTLSTREAAEILGVCPDTVRRWCVDGRVALMPRPSDEAPWRIPTARLLDDLGIAHEVVTFAPRPAAPDPGDRRGRTELHGSSAPGTLDPSEAAR